jgi:8-oxo-dGTP pyrophosphatase MutT (NUDIX family)
MSEVPTPFTHHSSLISASENSYTWRTRCNHREGLMQFVQSVEPAELAQLQQQWGPTRLQHERLEVDSPFLVAEHQLLVSDRRRAEVCYIMHRGDPAQGMLLHIKTFYPAGAFRLPTGGIHEGESVIETLAREIEEETGLVVGDGAEYVQVQRFLGVLSYELAHRTLGRSYSFATYHFLVQMPPNASLNPRDPEENIGGWQWCAPAELPQVAHFLHHVGALDPIWADWGRYRAFSHRFVAEMLGDKVTR